IRKRPRQLCDAAGRARRQSEVMLHRNAVARRHEMACDRLGPKREQCLDVVAFAHKASSHGSGLPRRRLEHGAKGELTLESGLQVKTCKWPWGNGGRQV